MKEGRKERRKKKRPGGKGRKNQNVKIDCYKCQNNRKTLLKFSPTQAAHTKRALAIIVLFTFLLL